MKFFLTGASGYIGGSVAQRLIELGHDVSGLVRSEQKAQQIQQLGIQPVIGTLADAAVLATAANLADAVIHAANSDDRASVETLLGALEGTGKLFIHVSGSSIVADEALGEYANPIAFTEDTPFEPVPNRKPRVEINHLVRSAGIDRGVRTVVICPPMIYGQGLGLQKDSDQIPKLAAFSKQAGAGVYFGKGLNRYANVFISDLVDLFVLAIEKAPAGSFFFAENGEASFKEIAELVSVKLGFGGNTQSVPVEAVVAQFGEAARYGAAGNSRVQAINARRLGWTPKGPSLQDAIEHEL
ncbi:MAG: NAD-dependent epimerase/dehydratase family protein [Edaphobacter sp.]